MATTRNIRPQTAGEWRLLFREIYGEHNRDGYTLEQIEIQLWNQHSKIAKAIRKRDFAGLPTQFAVFFGWYMAYLEEIGLDFEEAAWYKYPNVCLTCFVSEDCDCIRHKKKYNPTHPDLVIYRRDSMKMPHTIPEWQAMADRLFETINSLQSWENIWFHLVEEIGELSTEVALWDGNDPIPGTLKEEAGDVFLWFLGNCTRAKQEGVEGDVDAISWRTFPGHCNECRQTKCACPYRVRNKVTSKA